MDRQEALKVLARGGQGEEAMEVIEKWVNRAHSSYSRTREDDTRNSTYMRWALAVDFARADRELSDELVAMAKRVVAVDHGDAKKVFGIADIPGDTATLIISRRDAGDRASSISDRGELLAALDRATRSGDEVMARAIAERALELRDTKTLNRFADARPHLDAALERLWHTERGEDTGGMEFAMAMSSLRPSELDRMSLASIRALAAGEPGAA